MESKTPIVEIEHVNKSYRRGTRIIPVLLDITLRYCGRGIPGVDGTIGFREEHPSQPDRCP